MCIQGTLHKCVWQHVSICDLLTCLYAAQNASGQSSVTGNGTTSSSSSSSSVSPASCCSSNSSSSSRCSCSSTAWRLQRSSWVSGQ